MGILAIFDRANIFISGDRTLEQFGGRDGGRVSCSFSGLIIINLNIAIHFGPNVYHLEWIIQLQPKRCFMLCIRMFSIIFFGGSCWFQFVLRLL